MLLEKVKATVKKYDMLSPGDRIVVAVSGGPDSVCLLSILHDLSAELGMTLHVAHLDHMFRCERSAAEARFVRGLADKLRVPATIERTDVPSYCRKRGLSAQAGAREARYAFLDRVAGAVGAQKIAIGHTASDQAETFLMRLLRGAGVAGLSGIPPKRERIIRPLIDCTRNDVLDYLREQGLSFVTDPSNLKPVYTRNRIRLNIMPVLKSFNPRIEETLSAEANQLRDENEAMETRLAEMSPAILQREGDMVRIRRDEFNAALPALRKRLLRTAVEMLMESAVRELSLVQTDEAVAFMSTALTGRRMELTAGLHLEREYDAFILRPRTLPKGFQVRLAVPGVTAVPELSLEVETRVYDSSTLPFEFPSPQGRGDNDKELSEENYLWQAAFNYDKIDPHLYLRNRREGDRFRPSGMAGRSKKLQDYFVDEKVPRLKRDSIPVLATDNEILWVVGMRTDERFLPGPGTKRILTVTVTKKAHNAKSIGGENNSA